ncbi:hypothetical protein KQX54_018005 [Cotesia glomerata]|uniref:Uncharacterized protein n=1 Tax=Cotesia glomerata TaxID=32391 RepID=A0AAV7ID04_COTGL|nr:hypothetical protein KQX54_018005 [Cotesia glomerata]
MKEFELADSFRSGCLIERKHYTSEGRDIVFGLCLAQSPANSSGAAFAHLQRKYGFEISKITGWTRSKLERDNYQPVACSLVSSWSIRRPSIILAFPMSNEND